MSSYKFHPLYTFILLSTSPQPLQLSHVLRAFSSLLPITIIFSFPLGRPIIPASSKYIYSIPSSEAWKPISLLLIATCNLPCITLHVNHNLQFKCFGHITYHTPRLPDYYKFFWYINLDIIMLMKLAKCFFIWTLILLSWYKYYVDMYFFNCNWEVAFPTLQELVHNTATMIFKANQLFIYRGITWISHTRN